MHHPCVCVVVVVVPKEPLYSFRSHGEKSHSPWIFCLPLSDINSDRIRGSMVEGAWALESDLGSSPSKLDLALVSCGILGK